MGKKKGFGTVGVVLATAGSAVGLGNVWKFPYVLGQNGGAAFLIVYVGCVLLFGIPLMIADMYIGKKSHSPLNESFQKLSGKQAWGGVSMLLCVITIMLLSFYLVVTGWCLEYLWQSLCNSFEGYSPTQIANRFSAFSSSTGWPVFWTMVALFLGSAIELGGVEKGIERVSKVLMPLLLVILVIMIGRSLMMNGSTEGVRFLLQPDWSKMTGKAVLAAMGQCFFSLSIGMGILIAYASYMQPHQNLPATAVQVATIDSAVAILAGMAIFPAVFALGIDPTQGPELVFVTLPSVFSQMTAGYVFQVLFFMLMSIAAITSVVGLMEVNVSFLKGVTHGWSRPKRFCIIGPILLVMSVACSLSLSTDYEWLRLGGVSLFDRLDQITSLVLIPLAALLSSIFVGWVLPSVDLVKEMQENGHWPKWCGKVLVWLLKYLIPLAILVIFCDGLGIL